MNKPCGHISPDSTCRVCYLERTDPRYRALFRGGEMPAVETIKATLTTEPPPPLPLLDCKHLGDDTKKLVRCSTCQGTKLKVFGCTVFGEATIAKRGVGVGGCCAGCPKYEPKEQPVSHVSVIPPPSPSQVTWSCGVTTVPSRSQDLLPRTLKSIEAAGFISPWLFVDGATPEQACAYSALKVAGITFRSSPARVHGNWFLALHELWIRTPLADRYAIFQDDIILCRNVRQLIDQQDWPGGYLNLYTTENERYFAVDCKPKGPHKGWVHSTQRGKGALALVFDRKAVEALLTSRHMVMRPIPSEHKDVMAQKNGDWYRGQMVVDGGIVEALSAKAGIKEYIHLPSLAQHTGHVSSFSNLRHLLAKDFPGENFDATRLI